MTTPHKWANVIKAWADGKEIQYAYKCGSEEWITAIHPNFYSETIMWRIKPEIVKYRRYLVHSAGGVPFVIIAHQPSDNGMVERTWKDQFIRWIDDDWQEIEV